MRPAGLSGRCPRASATMEEAGGLSTRLSASGGGAPVVDAATGDDAEGGEGEDGDRELHGAVGDGEAPVARRAWSTARWCFDAARESCSLVSMSVSIVSSSGAGLSQAM